METVSYLCRNIKVMNTNFRRGRTLAKTVDDLLDSPRFNLCVAQFKKDPMLMKALLIELGMECMTVSKSAVIKRYVQSSSLDKEELAPFLRTIDPADCNTFNIYFNLSPAEVKLYLNADNRELSEEDRQELLDRVKRRFGMD